MHSPTKNQHKTSMVTNVLSHASLTGVFFQAPVFAPLTKFAIPATEDNWHEYRLNLQSNGSVSVAYSPARMAGISLIFGGVNSTKAYLAATCKFGRACCHKPAMGKSNSLFFFCSTVTSLCNSKALIIFRFGNQRNAN